MQENNIDINPGEVLKLSFINFDLKLLPHEMYEITNKLIKAVLPKGRYAVVDFSTETISLERGRNNLAHVASIPIKLFKRYEAFDLIIDKICEELLPYKEVVYLVFKNRGTLFQRFNLTSEHFNSFEKILANTKYRYIDLSFSKNTRQQIDFTYSKTICLNASIIDGLWIENNSDLPAGPCILYCVGKHYVDNKYETAFCLVSTVKDSDEYTTIHFKNIEPKILGLKDIRTIFTTNCEKAGALGLDNESIVYYALNQIALSSFSK